MIMIRRIFSSDFLLLPLFVYKCIQLFILKHRNDVAAIAIRLICTLSLIPVVALIIIILGLYHEIVAACLRLALGSNFYEMLDGCDRIWAKKSSTRNVICTLNTIKVNGKRNQCEELISYIRNKFVVICQTHPLFSTSLAQFAGLDYYCRIKLDMNECVRPMDDYSSMEELLGVLDRCANKEMPMNDKCLFEILIGTTPIKWQTEFVFPVLYRTHHSLADGATLVAIMVTHFVEGGVDVMMEKCDAIKQIMEKSRKANRKNKLLEHFEKVLQVPTIVSPQKPNILHRAPNCGKKHMIFALEKPGCEMLRKVKEIKNFYGVAFSDVISTAISASLCDHFQKFEKDPPKTIISMCPTYLMMMDFKKSISIKNGVAVLHLGNKFSLGFVKIPINIQSGSNNNVIGKLSESNELVERLEAMHKEQNKLKNSLDYAFSYWQMKMLTGLPNAFGHYMLSLHDTTLCISNIPGYTKCMYTDGSQVTDVVAFGNNYQNTGLSITLFTYDDLIRIGVIIDHTLIEQRDEAQIIGDNIFKYIEDMHSQLNTIHRF